MIEPQILTSRSDSMKQSFRSFIKWSLLGSLVLSGVIGGSITMSSPARASGAYGPDTCVQGYVWREAVPEANAGPHIWLTDWTVPPTCTGDTCTSTSTDDIPRFKVNGDHFTVGGQVGIGFKRVQTGAWVYQYSTTASIHNGFALGTFGERTNQFDCSRDTHSSLNYYVRAYDWSTGRWSNRIFVRVCGAVL
jgi:hypothetical protein